MALLAGIDEAGYGPVLGPLVATAAVFEVPDDRLNEDLWHTLRRTIARTAARRRSRLLIADSKKLYNGRKDLAELERPALVMARTAGWRGDSMTALLARLHPGILDPIAEYPWYRDVDRPLPCAVTAEELAVRANAVAADMRRAGVRLLGIISEILFAGRFNELVNCTRNKATVLTDTAMKLVDRLMRAAADRPLNVVIDRHGARRNYRQPLMTCFAGTALRIDEENDHRSAYTLNGRPAPVRLEFITAAEDRHLPVALASIVSKYVRELFMASLNAFFSTRSPGLRPTAGYYTDGRRFLRDIDPLIADDHRCRRLLIRTR